MFERVQLGVRALHKHLLTLVDKHEEHQLNMCADTCKLYGGRASREALEPYVNVALQLCRVSRELAKKKSTKKLETPTEKPTKAPQSTVCSLVILTFSSSPLEMDIKEWE